MVDVRPFRALFPPPALAARVAAVPYDVVDTAEAKALAEGNPDSFLHVTRAEIDLPGTDEHADAVYARARAALLELLSRGALVQEPEPVLYVYRLTMGGSSQTGIVGGFSVEDYEQGRVVKHEKTRPDKEEDRTRHILELRAHAEPVFLIHRPDATLARLIEGVVAAKEGKPPMRFTAPDGVEHVLWRVTDAAPFTRAFAAMGQVYVADGHHRSAAAANARRRLREQGELSGPDDPAERFLGVSFPADEARILPYHRLVKELNGRTPERFLEELRGVGRLELAADGEARRGEARVYLGGRWWSLALTPAKQDPVSRLDVQALQDRVLGPLLGIQDVRTDQRIAFVGGIRGWPVLARAVDQGKAAVAFSMAAVEVEELLAVADAGAIMPPKSTWFEPKLRSGLFVLPIR